MRSLEDVQSLAKQSIALGTVTFLCLNAGIGKYHSFTQGLCAHSCLSAAPAMHLDGITLELYDDVFNVNLRGEYRDF